MNNTIIKISPVRKLRFSTQGYLNFSDKELNDYKYGIRFAYALCAALVATALIFDSIILLAIITIIAFAGIFPPYHPFDYLYNYGVRYMLDKPKIPPRTDQGRFACGIAFVWLLITIYLIYNNQLVAGTVFGAVLLSIAILVSTTDICIPSIVYNFLFGKVRHS